MTNPGYLVTSANIIDPKSASTRSGATVAVIGDRIAGVYGTESEGRRNHGDLTVLDLDGRTLLPGLIDAHLHLAMSVPRGSRSAGDYWHRADPPELLALYMSRNADETLLSGVTSARDMGEHRGVNVAVRAALERRIARGPRLLTCGRPILPTGGSGGWWRECEVDGPENIRAAVRDRVKAGAEFIKVIATGGSNSQFIPQNASIYTREEIETAIDEAHRLGVRVAVHASGGIGARWAVEAGADTIEHGKFLDDETLHEMAQRGTFYVPTLSVVYGIATDGEAKLMPRHFVENARAARKEHIRTVRRAHELGVKIAAGTDWEHGLIARELELLSEAGLPRMAALAAATSNAAAAIGLGTTCGAIEPNQSADLIVVEKDPLSDLRALREIDMVMLRGEIIRTVDAPAPVPAA